MIIHGREIDARDFICGTASAGRQLISVFLSQFIIFVYTSNTFVRSGTESRGGNGPKMIGGTRSTINFREVTRRPVLVVR